MIRAFPKGHRSSGSGTGAQAQRSESGGYMAQTAEELTPASAEYNMVRPQASVPSTPVSASTDGHVGDHSASLSRMLVTASSIGGAVAFVGASVGGVIGAIGGGIVGVLLGLVVQRSHTSK